MQSTTALLSVFLVAFLLLGTAPLAAQNSTKKIRPAASAQAAGVGQSVQWRHDVDEARQEASKAKLPLFWYVPTIRGSFMDRKPELDLYLMGGMFSWPWMIDFLNTQTIPVKAPADEALGKRYGLEPIAFIEPGILILPPKNSQKRYLLKLDRLDTFHPAWMRQRIAEALERPELADDSPYPVMLVNGKTWFTQMPLAEEAAVTAALQELATKEGKDAVAEALWLLGAGCWDHQRERQAEQWWSQLRDEHGAHPLAAKAALELEDQGPYVHGFESYAPLPEALLTMGPAGSQMAKNAQTEAEGRARAVAFLLRMQRTDGSWRDSIYDFGGTDSMPNVHLAVTALAARSLRLQMHGLDATQEAAVAKALTRAEAYMKNDSHRNPVDKDELVWAELYRLRYWLTRLPKEATAARGPSTAAGDNEEAAKRVQDLLRMQESDGSWAHEYPNPFVTAVVLIALQHADRAGLGSRELEVAAHKGLEALELSRSREGAYSYGQGRGKVNTPLVASVGRSPVGELARWLWEEDKEDSVSSTLEAAFQNQSELFQARKYDDHTNMHAYGGFFFWFALEGRAEAIAALQDQDMRERLAERLRQEILALPECDGAFLDSHELGRSYGTAMALISLAHLNQAQASR